jgi:uncharacterized membrane protein YfcA
MVALLTFMLLGNVDYSTGAVMGTGLLAGSWLGARSAIRFGAPFIRPIFLCVVIIMALHGLYEIYF